MAIAQDNKVWRTIASPTTQPASGNNVGVVAINPCACIEKVMEAAKAKAKEQPKNDLTGDKKAKNMRSARAAVQFDADVKGYEIGKTAKAVYTDGESPAKWRIATDAELKDYGFKRGKADLSLQIKGSPSHFRAQVFVPIKERFCYEMPAVLVFRGTVMNTRDQAIESWLNNLYQGANFESDYYKKAVQLGAMVKNAKKPIAIVGHSLGGGMAQACSKTSGKNCWHYNSAGLHPNTVEKYGEVPVKSCIRAYHHSGEILTWAQEMSTAHKAAASAVLIGTGTIVRGIIGAGVGAYGAKKLFEMPKAVYDRRLDFEPIQPKTQTGMFADIEYRVFLHGMSETLDSLRAKLKKTEDTVRKELGVECKSRIVE